MDWTSIIAKIGVAFLKPFLDMLGEWLDKLWAKLDGWIADQEARLAKARDDKETKDEGDSIHNGGRPSAA